MPNICYTERIIKKPFSYSIISQSKKKMALAKKTIYFPNASTERFQKIFERNLNSLVGLFSVSCLEKDPIAHLTKMTEHLKNIKVTCITSTDVEYCPEKDLQSILVNMKNIKMSIR